VSSHAEFKNLRLKQPLPHRPKATIVAICVFLAAITWLVFGQTLRHEFINYDDDTYVYKNAEVIGGLSLHGVIWAFTHSHSNNWHPLTWISHMLDCQLFGLNAGGHHFTNVLLHTIAVILLFLLLRQMTGGPSRTGSIWRSAFVAALFAIHPLRVESVAWVAERKDVLSGVFFMLTLGAYVRYVRNPSLVRYLTMSILFALGLMSKPMLVTLPFVLLLLDSWPLQRQSSWRRLIVEKIPLLALSAGSCVATLLAQKEAIGLIERLPLWQRVGNAFVSYVVYIWQMLWPANLAPFYPHPKDHLPILEIILASTLLVAITAATFALRKERPYFLTGWLWYLGMLVPVIGLIQVGMQGHADRYTYLPQIGLYFALTWAIGDLSALWHRRREILTAMAAIVIAGLTWCAWKQTSSWRDSEKLWTHTLAVTSNNDVAHNNLAGVRLQRGQLDEAIADYQKARQLRSERRNADNLAETEYNLGEALLQQGSMDEAMSHFQKVLEIWPDHAEAHNNVGGILLQQGQVNEAIAHFEKALEKAPDLARAHNNLGNALLQKGEIDEAIVHYQKALELPFDHGEAHYNLANALLQKGEIDEAITHYRTALEMRPNHANSHNNLGTALRRKGLMEEAILQYQRAAELEPASALFQNNLAWMLATCPDASLRDGVKAVELAEQANQLSGGSNLIVLHTLAAAYAESGRLAEAIATAQRAVELADAQGNTTLSKSLEQEIDLYQKGSPYRER
jgi:tetratricopeptide (TPR) repeat protein